LWHQDRRSRIVNLVRDGARATTSTLARELGVSRETVRRDLLSLETEGLLQRVHGGAVSFEPENEAPFERRRRHRWGEKLAIGRAAARMIEDGQIVFVDAGTTTLAFAEALADRPRVKVVTNSIGVAQRLGAQAVLLGGEISSDVPATFGELTLAGIERFQTDIAFIAPVAIDAALGAMNFALQEAEIARAMLRRAGRTVLLADHSKLGTLSRVSICGLDQVEAIVTDKAPDAIGDACKICVASD
jgi:DeoR/GlpR family transcriptional regulator of sugar metabolism